MGFPAFNHKQKLCSNGRAIPQQRSYTPNPILLQEPCETTGGPSAGCVLRAVAKPLRTAARTGRDRVTERGTTSSQGTTWGPKQISGVDQVFQVRYLDIKPTQITTPAVQCVCGVHGAISSSRSAAWVRIKTPELPNPHKLAKGAEFNPVS